MKLTKEKLNKIEYKSIKDFYEKFDRFDSLEDKMKFTTRYLLAHDAQRHMIIHFILLLCLQN